MWRVQAYNDNLTKIATDWVSWSSTEYQRLQQAENKPIQKQIHKVFTLAKFLPFEFKLQGEMETVVFKPLGFGYKNL